MKDNCQCGKEKDTRANICRSCASKIKGAAGRGVSRNKGKATWNKGKKQSPEWIQKRLESRGMKYNEGPVWTKGERGAKNSWSRAVKKRDRCCVYCHSTDKLHAHHILSAHKHPEFRLFVDNGITLCYSCHWDEHRLNGYL